MGNENTQQDMVDLRSYRSPTKLGDPLLKWPGSKRLLLKHFFRLVPQRFERYYEPFFGGGSLFFALRPDKAVLSDINTDLINCYLHVRNFPEELISRLARIDTDRETYYSVRKQNPDNAMEQAVKFLYLTGLAFNGIYRVNLAGRFNVPYGDGIVSRSCDPDKIRAVSASLATAEIQCADFQDVALLAVQGDFVYFDPPYTVAHANNGFIEYNARIFSWQDQERLASVARELADRGCHVLVSNADHPSIHNLYPSFEFSTIYRASTVAASRAHRRQISECLFYSKR